MARQSKQRVAAVEMCLGKLRCDRDGLAKADKRFLVAPKIKECGTPVAPVFRRARLDAERAVVALDGIRMAAQLDQHIAAVAMRVGEVGSTRDRLVEVRERFL